MRQRTVFVNFKRFLILLECIREIAYFYKLLAALDRYGDTHAAIESQYLVIRVERYGARLAERVYAEFARSADNLNFFIFGVAFGFDAKIDRHAEGVHILRDFSDDTEPF